MSRDELSYLFIQAADYFPPEEVVVEAWNKYKNKRASTILKAIKQTGLYVTHFQSYRSQIAHIISDVPDAQLGQDILAIIDTYYPGIIAEIAENDKNGDRTYGDLLKKVILGFIAEVRV